LAGIVIRVRQPEAMSNLMGGECREHRLRVEDNAGERIRCSGSGRKRDKAAILPGLAMLPGPESSN
jgi:hypothetical protein